MGKVSTVVGKMPFAGRALVENAALYSVCERTSLNTKKAKAIKSAAFLGLFAVIHGVQARMGIMDFTHDVHEFGQNAGIGNLAESAISGAYALANTAVTYTQLQIGGRVLKNYRDFRNDYQDGQELADRNYRFRLQQPTLIELGATIAGQMVFLAFNDH